MKSVICYYPKGHTLYQGQMHDNEALGNLFAQGVKEGRSFPVPDDFTLVVLEIFEDGEDWKKPE